jgi:hypothetical protein
MRFIGLPYVYSFDQLGSNCGLVGPHAMADLNGTIYWMSRDGFFAYNGGAPAKIPCSIWRHVFQNINEMQEDKITAALNTSANEVIWFYPSAASTENDSYAVYNYAENEFYYGKLSRTAWADTSVFPKPLGLAPDGTLYQHETGWDDDGKPMQCFIETGYMDLGDGEDFVFLDRIIPDFGSDMTGSVQITVNTLTEPNAQPITSGPFTIKPGTRYVTFNSRGRQASFRVSSANAGDFWRWGATRVNITPDGRR